MSFSSTLPESHNELSLELQTKPDSLLQKILGLSEWPFLTDAQVEELFGNQVSHALSFLDGFSREQGICSSCGGKCCEEMSCELYLEDFGECPIYDHRPLLCRSHYCHRFGKEQRPLIEGVRDVCLDVIDKLPPGSRAYRGLELNLLLYGAYRNQEDSLPDMFLEMRRVIEAVKERKLSKVKAKGILQRFMIQRV